MRIFIQKKKKNTAGQTVQKRIFFSQQDKMSLCTFLDFREQWQNLATIYQIDVRLHTIIYRRSSCTCAEMTGTHGHKIPSSVERIVLIFT